jgi:hypothetical protein
MKEHIDGATNGNGRLYPHNMSSVWYLNYRGQFKVQAMRTWIYHEATVWLARKRDRIDGFAPGKRKGYPTANTDVGTAGRVSAETIQRYIDEQRGT